MAINERPILFSGPMIRAILDGRKEQTRRIMKPQPAADIRPITLPMQAWESSLRHKYGVETIHTCPFGQQGRRLWVRETWCPANSDDGPVVLYKADSVRRYMMHEKSALNARGEFDYDRFPAGRFAWDSWAADVESGSTKDWRPSLHMPRWASRITLEILDVRVERLLDISAADAIAEGATSKPNAYGFNNQDDGWSMDWPDVEPEQGWKWLALGTPQLAFAAYVNELHGGKDWNLKPEGQELWNVNPWVWSISFRRIEKEQR